MKIFILSFVIIILLGLRVLYNLGVYKTENFLSDNHYEVSGQLTSPSPQLSSDETVDSISIFRKGRITLVEPCHIDFYFRVHSEELISSVNIEKFTYIDTSNREEQNLLERDLPKFKYYESGGESSLEKATMVQMRIEPFRCEEMEIEFEFEGVACGDTNCERVGFNGSTKFIREMRSGSSW